MQRREVFLFHRPRMLSDRLPNSELQRLLAPHPRSNRVTAVTEEAQKDSDLFVDRLRCRHLFQACGLIPLDLRSVTSTSILLAEYANQVPHGVLDKGNGAVAKAIGS